MTTFFNRPATSAQTIAEKAFKNYVERANQLAIREEQKAANKFMNRFAALTQHQNNNTARLFQPGKTHRPTNASPKHTMGPRNK